MRTETVVIDHRSDGLVSFLNRARTRKASKEARPTLEKLRHPVPLRADAIGSPGEDVPVIPDLGDAVDRGRNRVYWYVPSVARRLTIYVHGGGWVSGSQSMLDTFAQQLAHETESVVAFIEYRLAPEHPLPTPFDDVVHGVISVVKAWKTGMAPAVSKGGIYLLGDSAGGHLAALALSWLVDHDYDIFESIDGVALVYPALDPFMTSDSYRKARDAPTLTAQDMNYSWSVYTRGYSDLRRLSACTEFVESLESRLMVVTTGLDPLRDEGMRLVSKAAAADVDVLHVDYPHCPHGILWMAGILPEGRDLLKRIGLFLSMTDETVDALHEK